MDPIVAYILAKRKLKQKRQFWVHPLIRIRNVVGEHLKLESMFHSYPDKFQEHTRLTVNQFAKLEQLMKDSKLVKKTTNFREPIPMRMRLLITLRYLATGDSMQSLGTSFCVGKTTVRVIIAETCQELWNILVSTYLQAPQSKSDWLKIAQEFQDLWQLPNCIGALDGKHVQIVAPNKTGSQYFNYKGTFSIVLLATCTAKHLFTTVDIGAFGKQSDGGVLLNSGLGKLLDQKKLKIEGSHMLPNSPQHLPLYFVGDEAFPLKTNILRPYPGKDLDTKKRIFNYRLSRGRRVIENSFGILTSRFRVLRKPLHLNPANATSVVKACVVLHNYILTEENASVFESRTPLTDRTNYENSNMSGMNVSDVLTNYFMNEGQVPWQYDSVFLLK